ncbi:MAG: hypothetical protein CM15mP9_1890 [Methanobacteriota archaeon]|nr:MAG: hypothetical protein CM15mP9_1890 [Euryarchaeota archaeon]
MGGFTLQGAQLGESWEQESLRVSPAGVISTAFPQTDAGPPEICCSYLGSENASLLGEPDLGEIHGMEMGTTP